MSRTSHHSQEHSGAQGRKGALLLGSAKSAIRLQLLQRLNTLDLPAFERLVIQLLRQTGYHEVQLVERIDRRGRTLIGGLDARAFAGTDIADCLTIAQIKRHTDLVPRRCIDEIRGAMLRLGGRHGVIVSTSTFSPAARQAASTVELLPVALIDGEALVDLLVGRNLGVKTVTVTRMVTSEEEVIDEAFFDNVAKKRISTDA